MRRLTAFFRQPGSRVAGSGLALATLVLISAAATATAAPVAQPLAPPAPPLIQSPASPVSQRLLDPPALWLLATLQGTFQGAPNSQSQFYCDQLGNAVAVSGDTAVVGAPYYQDVGQYHRGRVYVFVRSGVSWTQQQILSLPDPQMDASYFGCSVAIDGDTMIVGAYGHGSTDGSAYVFTRSGATWSLQEELDGSHYSDLGWSVAISGDTALISTYGGPHGNGSALVYTRSGSSWTNSATLVGSDSVAGDGFGWAVALSGGTAVVGAPFRDGPFPNGPGAAYVFTTSGGGWSQQCAVYGTAHDNLGRAVAVSGQTALVGAPMANGYTGKVEVLGDTGTGWAYQADRTGDDSTYGDLYGWAVALSGDTALVGAEHRTDGANLYAGATYALVRDTGAWTQRAELRPPDAVLQGQFGFALGLDGPTAIVGAPNQSDNSKGYTYAYLLSSSVDITPPVTTAAYPSGWTNEARVTLSPTDDISGVKATYYQLQGDSAWTTYTGPFYVDTQGTWQYSYYSVDEAGNPETPQTLTVNIDATPPVSGGSMSPSGWTRGPVHITLSGSDAGGSGLAGIYYTIGSGSGLTYSTPFTVSTAALVHFWSVDNAENSSSTHVLKPLIDRVGPQTYGLATVSVKAGATTTFKFRINDVTPTTASSSLCIYKGRALKKTIKLGKQRTGRALSYRWRCTLPKGTYTWKILATDLAGNKQAKVVAKTLAVK
jgi:hypothetical protein